MYFCIGIRSLFVSVSFKYYNVLNRVSRFFSLVIGGLKSGGGEEEDELELWCPQPRLFMTLVAGTARMLCFASSACKQGGKEWGKPPPSNPLMRFFTGGGQDFAT